MGSVDHNPELDWTEAELLAVVILFQRLGARDVVPGVLYAIATDGRPCAIFNGSMTPQEADVIGGAVTAALEALSRAAR